MLHMDISDAIWVFGNLPSSMDTAIYNATIFLVVFVSFVLLERKIPRKKWSEQVLLNSYESNFGLFLINNIVLTIFSASTLLEVAEHYSTRWLSDHISPTTRLILSFLFFDLTLYIWHRISHRYAFLWQFHRVHHSDTTMNVSTAFRVHVLDHLSMMAFKAAYVAGFGIDKETLAWNEAITTLFLMLHHSNVIFKGEKILGHFIIVPNLHRLHHSMIRREHDSNYGAVLSIWDRLFGTLNENHSDVLGISESISNDLLGLIKAGFWSGIKTPAREIDIQALEFMIAEAAYYKAEKRNFSPGNDIQDWLEAKQEIIRQLYEKKYRIQTVYLKRKIWC